MEAKGFPGGSAGKESAGNVRDLDSNPGWRRSSGEGKGWLPTPIFWPGEFHELYSPWGHKEPYTTKQLSLWTSLVAQTVKCLLTMQETWV